MPTFFKRFEWAQNRLGREPLLWALFFVSWVLCCYCIIADVRYLTNSTMPSKFSAKSLWIGAVVVSPIMHGILRTWNPKRNKIAEKEIFPRRLSRATTSHRDKRIEEPPIRSHLILVYCALVQVSDNASSSRRIRTSDAKDRSIALLLPIYKVVATWKPLCTTSFRALVINHIMVQL